MAKMAKNPVVFPSAIFDFTFRPAYTSTSELRV
jgi:hypothetical protein